MNKLKKTSFTYTPLFCEENIWKFIESIKSNSNIKPIDVLFLINENNTIALFNQLKSVDNQPVIWDYHVILSAHYNNKVVIYDFDSQSPFPCDINSYFNLTFRPDIELPQTYQTFLKPIAADLFFRDFTSSRDHMIGIIPDSEFPEYDIIAPGNTQSTLPLSLCREYKVSDPDFSILTPKAYLGYMSPGAKL